MRRILIVDSDTQVSTILALKLKQIGYEVKTISSTINALILVKNFKPALIISEMLLPELSGVDFLKRLKLNPISSSIPFIFLSSSRNVEDKIIAHDMGAEAFFVKPIFLKVLIRRIEDFFDQKEYDQILTGSIYNNVFKGKLIDITLLDLLNIINENTKAGHIIITAENQRKGTIFFNHNSIVRVEIENISNQPGEDMLFSMLSWVDGLFVISYNAIDVSPNIDTPLGTLIAQCTNWLQEYNNNLGDLPALDSKIFLDFGRLITNFSRIPDNVGSVVRHIPHAGIRLGDLISQTKGDRKSIVEYIKQLVNIGVIQKTEVDTPVTLPSLPAWLTEPRDTTLLNSPPPTLEPHRDSMPPVDAEPPVDPTPLPMNLELAPENEKSNMQPDFMELDLWEEKKEEEKSESQREESPLGTREREEKDDIPHPSNSAEHEFSQKDLDELFPEKNYKSLYITIALLFLVALISIAIFYLR
ncbi:response regulator [bacterium]|nr:response regulator [bacterium]